MAKVRLSYFLRRVLPWFVGVVVVCALPVFAPVINPAAAPPLVSLIPAPYRPSVQDRTSYQEVTGGKQPLYVSSLTERASGEWQPAALCVPGAHGLTLNSHPGISTIDGVETIIPGLQSCQTRSLSLSDFALQVEATILAGQGRDGISIAFRSLSNGDSLRFQIGVAGYYSLANTHAVIMEGSSNRPLLLQEKNIIAMVAHGDLLRFYLNGDFIARYTFPGSHHEQHFTLLAYAIEQQTEVVYRNLKVWNLHDVSVP